MTDEEEMKDLVLSSSSFRIVKQFFQNDSQKAFVWFLTVNPLIENIPPVLFLMQGREDKLRELITSTQSLISPFEEKPLGGFEFKDAPT